MEEQKVIRRFAAAQPAIFVGHCASEALKEYPNVVNVFIHCSSDEQKKERILHDYGIAPVQADVVRRKYDKKRANYYKANTERKGIISGIMTWFWTVQSWALTDAWMHCMAL